MTLYIGLAGRIGSGKSTVAELIRAHWESEVRGYSKYLKSILESKGKEVNRKNLQDVGADVLETRGAIWLTEQILRDCTRTMVVIDGVRSVSVVDHLRCKYAEKFRLVFVEMCDQKRIDCVNTRGREMHSASIEMHPVEREAENLRELCDAVIYNDGSKENLKSSVVEVIAEMRKRYHES